ncbi:MAG: DUF3375 domain-containing protein [Spirochaetales bacterium]|nr:DUF3375 domain-containing protein [Spirochaetales bacterium]
MTVQELSIMIKDNPALKILRAQKAPQILAFLWQEFKSRQKITIPAEELIISLSAFLENHDEADDEIPEYLDNAARMIDSWCREENRYLRKYVNERGVIVHELTGYIERVFRWLEDLKPRESVGTESRFYDILRRLEELVSKSLENPEEKIKELKEKRKAIDQEMKEIEKSGMVRSFDNWQIKERFEEISRSSRDLLADFKEVEENFKFIVDQIYKEEANMGLSRGDILGATLDAHQDLKQSPQGKTFHSFWSFLITDSGTDSISRLVEKVYDVLEAKSLSSEDSFLKNLKTYLHRAGKRIIDSNHRLGDKINRLLSENTLLQRRRIKELMQEIKQLVFAAKDTPPGDDFFMELDGDAEITMPMERPLRFPEEETVYKNIDLSDDTMNLGQVAGLFNQFYVDRRKLEANIRKLLMEKPEVRIKDVLEAFPPEKGLSEILVYYEIASSSRSSRIMDETSVTIDYVFNNIRKSLRAPEVIFLR